jgi:hypothetical protein
MGFDLPLTAFSLESAGAAARALGVCHTLTLPEPSNLETGVPNPPMALAAAADEQEDALRIGDGHDAPLPLTITF